MSDIDLAAEPDPTTEPDAFVERMTWAMAGALMWRVGRGDVLEDYSLDDDKDIVAAWRFSLAWARNWAQVHIDDIEEARRDAELEDLPLKFKRAKEKR